MRGLMQDSPLTIDTIFRHAEQHYGDVPIVTNSPQGVTRSTYGEWADRTRRLGGWATAALFVAVFPGNVTMVVTARTPRARAVTLARLPLQVPLVLWAVRVARR